MKKYTYIIGLSTIALASCKPTPIKDMEPSSGKVVETAPSELKSIDIGFMNNQINPSDDFFLFANGTWCLKNPVPASESRWGSFNELDQRNKAILTEILKLYQATSGEKGTQSQLLGDYSKSFQDMEQRNKIGFNPVKEKLLKIKGIKSREEIAKLVAQQHRVGIRSLFGFGVGQDMKNVEKNAVYQGQGGLGLPNKKYYTDDSKAEIRQKYLEYITACLELAGTPTENAKSDAKSILIFETRLAEGMMNPEEARLPEKTYNKMSYKDMRKLCPSFDFEGYVTTLGAQSFDSVIVGQPDFLKTINNLIGELPMEDWINYLSWKTINHYAGSLDEQWVRLNFSFYQGVLSGKKEMKPINERAIDNITGSLLAEIMGKAFVEKSYSQKAQERVNKMVDNLLVAFQNRIKGLDWMSKETKAEALTKLNAIGRKLGFPEEWRDFSKLDIKADNYIQNIDNCAIYETEEELGKLYKPVNRKEWGMPAHLVNAYYNPLLNEIAFPAGIMQPPFFDENAEDAVNYGRIGMVIGHEFTHGFDDNGSKYAANGNLSDWWQKDDRVAFEERTKLLGETFSGFCPFDDHCVNADLTMGENIADLGGLTMAYYAYSMTSEFKSGKKVNGFTPAQRFFIAYAQLWKINYTDAEMKNRIANDPHSPGMYRVNGPLMNCPEFFEAFNIPEGAKMRNSTERISRIW